MKTNTPLLAAAALISSLQFASAADLTGKVTLKGTPPPEITIQMDATCGKLHDKPVTTRHYVVGEGNGLANVFVYVKSGLEGKKFDAPAETPLLDQIDCIYEPYIIGVMTNQKFKVKNSDPLFHNVHATPRNPSNKEFNIGQLHNVVTEKSFPAQEILVRIKCDVHPWMFGYVGVVDHPFFAVTDKDGNFKIPNLPPGKYTVEAYHLKTHGTNPGVSQEITVEGDAKADFTVELKAK